MSKAAWEALKNHYQSVRGGTLQALFAADPNRYARFSVQVEDFLFDFSKQRITPETFEKLCQFAENHHLRDHIDALFSGKRVNLTEQRPALHMALRDPGLAPLRVDGLEIKEQIHASLEKMAQFVEGFSSGQRVGATDKRITDVVSLGIGGSDLGPKMACFALEHFRTSEIKLHFIANVDGATVSRVLKSLNPETTLCIINSKTFTTIETLQNAKTLKTWFQHSLGEKSTEQHLIGVTANKSAAMQFGISNENIFEFWDFVGGRYSIWSSVGLPIALLIGMPQFREFLAGAYAIDKHFCSAPFSENIPVLMALLGIWNINFCGYSTHAIIPYEDGLEYFPDYLQQLEMESNGKRAAKENGFVEHSTAPIIWGGVGCNNQHAYMQLLHQGTQVVPVDFLVAAKAHPQFEEHHQLLLASCLSQSKALMEGNFSFPENDFARERCLDAKRCFGDRPSSTLMYTALTPRVLGALIALYEHKVFVQGVLWGINSFDQFGVELGKTLVKEILAQLEQSTDKNLDSSTQGLIEFYRKNKVAVKPT